MSTSGIQMHEYAIVGRKLPCATDPVPRLFKMRIFARDAIVAKSRFFYFLKRLSKIKRSAGEIVSMSEVFEKHPLQIKNFGIWLRYDSRSGTHNMYKEYRELSRADAVRACYQDMASRHRARFRSIQIIKVVSLKSAEVRRPYVRQLLQPKLKFPLAHRVYRAAEKSQRSLFVAHRPSTFQ